MNCSRRNFVSGMSALMLVAGTSNKTLAVALSEEK